jgi:hypothetical protein
MKPELNETALHATNLSHIVAAIIQAHPSYLGSGPGSDYEAAEVDPLMEKAMEIYDAIREKADECAFH